jgi:hypothetical protein
MKRARRTFVIGLVVSVGLLATACGGDDDAKTGSASDDAASTTANTSDGTSTTQKGQSAAYPSCPITAEEVASVTGEPMVVEQGVCQFRPTSGKLEPSVLFVKQSAILADADVRTEDGYVTTVEGIGDEAYATGEGTAESRVAVRDGQQWFEVSVDTLTGSTTEIDWAKKLAKIIADNN